MKGKLILATNSVTDNAAGHLDYFTEREKYVNK